MGIGAAATQKAKVLQLFVDRFTDQWGRGPALLHVVVVPSFTTVKTQLCRRFNQGGEPQSVATWMSKDCKPSGAMDGFADLTSPKWSTDCSIAALIGQKGRMSWRKAKSQNVDQASAQDATDFHPTP